jgi:hypothetical protein
MKKTNMLKTILINVIVFVALIVVTDRLIPVISKQDTGDRDRHIALREHNTNMDVYIKSEEQRIRVRTNGQGFIIGSDYKLNQHADFIFLGGSTTESFLVEEDLRFPYLSIKKLNDEINTEFVSLNGGVSGSNLYHSYINLVSKVISLKPSYVIVMNAVNDYSYLNKYPSYFVGPRKPIVENEISLYSFFKKIKDFLIPNLYNSIRSIFLISDLGAIPGGPDALKIQEKAEDPLKEYEKLLRVFINTAREFEIEPILMTQFNNYKNEKILSSSKLKEYNLFNSKIREISYEFKVTLIDLDSIVPKKSEFFYDGAHLNDLGSKFVSEKIKEALIILFENERFN